MQCFWIKTLKAMKKLICIIGVICLIIGSVISIPQQRGNGLEFIENRGQIVDMEGNIRPDILFVGDRVRPGDILTAIDRKCFENLEELSMYLVLWSKV